VPAVARGIDTYRRTNVHTRSPLELVVMLYDGALQSLGDARDAMARKDVGTRTTAISRALAILTELQGTLNMKEGGAIAEELDRLYAFAISRLVDVTTKRDASAIDEIVRVLTPLRDGWSQIAQQAAAQR
jgi:flagellar secretion chaperone FliS